MYKRTLSAAEASARPMRESRTQLPARRPVDGVEVSGCGTRSATLQPQRAGTLAAPIGQRHRAFWAPAVRCAPRRAAWKRAACLWRYAGAPQQPFAAQRLLGARWLLYGATGCLLRQRTAFLARRGPAGEALIEGVNPSTCGNRPIALRDSTTGPEGWLGNAGSGEA